LLPLHHLEGDSRCKCGVYQLDPTNCREADRESCRSAQCTGTTIKYLVADLQPGPQIEMESRYQWHRSRWRVRVTQTMPPVAELTEREREVLKLVSTGATNREIADALYIGEATVKATSLISWVDLVCATAHRRPCMLATTIWDSGVASFPRMTSGREVVTIAEKWRPFRSLATSYLFSAVF
jgi:hypothetical protein